MPDLKTRCPECDTKIRRTVDEPGEYDLKCPDCGHAFVAEVDDEDDRDERPSRYLGLPRDEMATWFTRHPAGLLVSA